MVQSEDRASRPATHPCRALNLVIGSDLQFPGLVHDLHAACSYSLISPPRMLRHRIFAVAGSVTTAGVLSALLGGRRFRSGGSACSVNVHFCLNRGRGSRRLRRGRYGRVQQAAAPHRPRPSASGRRRATARLPRHVPGRTDVLDERHVSRAASGVPPTLASSSGHSNTGSSAPGTAEHQALQPLIKIIIRNGALETLRSGFI